MSFEIVGEIREVETVALGGSIRDLRRLQKQYGAGRWRRLKGVGKVRLADGTMLMVELHWYEAHGIGKKEVKIKSPRCKP
jgi:hypothetical protein